MWDDKGEFPGYHRGHCALRTARMHLTELRQGDVVTVCIRENKILFGRNLEGEDGNRLFVRKSGISDTCYYQPHLERMGSAGPDFVASMIEIVTGLQCQVVHEKKDEFVTFVLAASPAPTVHP